MTIKLSDLEKMLLLSVLFTITLTATRYFYTNEAAYLFYPWNLFLAAVPLYFSRQLHKFKRAGLSSFIFLACWLLFLPNAPYLITDLFHFEERKPMPYWYDLILVTSGAWNGLVLGIVPLMQVEKFLSAHIRRSLLVPAMLVLIIICSYGIYLGRYNRYNSWDIITSPLDITHTIFVHCTAPLSHTGVWLFTFGFTALLSLIYFTIKKIPAMLKTAA